MYEYKRPAMITSPRGAFHMFTTPECGPGNRKKKERLRKSKKRHKTNSKIKRKQMREVPPRRRNLPHQNQ